MNEYPDPKIVGDHLNDEVSRHIPPRNLREVGVRPVPKPPVSEFAPRPRPAPRPMPMEPEPPVVEPVKLDTMSGTGLLQVADSAMHTVMDAVEEAEARTKKLREQAELCVKHLRAWSTEFAAQHMQLLEQCTTLESSINQAVDVIKQIGSKPAAAPPVEKSDHEQGA